MIRKLLILILVLVVLVVGVLVGVVVFAGSLAKAGIEKGGTYALGVPTKVDNVSIGFLSGKLAIRRLDVGNPQGFDAPHFLDLGEAKVQVGLASLTKETISVPLFSLDRLDVQLQKKAGTANYDVILENLKKVSGGGEGGKPAPRPSTGEEKKLVIDDLSLTNVTVNVDLFDAPGGLTKVRIPIKEIRLQKVGQTGSGVGGTGVTIGQLASIIVQAVMQATIENGQNLLPADMLGDLQGRLAALGDVKELGMKVVGDVKGTVEKVGGEAAKAVEEGKKAVDDIGKKAEEVKKGLEGLIPKRN
jgi:uncharacterized protein involved in outer membrane biogenesis